MRRREVTDRDAAVVGASGWLSLQPEAFRSEVLAHAVGQYYPTGSAIYHLGDPVGGIYGVVSGGITVTTAPGSAMPRLIHVGGPGLWTGEGAFLTGGPRRVTLRVPVATRVLYVPLKAMEAMVVRDPTALRHFAQMPILNLDVLVRVVHDLLIRDADRRIAAVLLRLCSGGATLSMSQQDIGELASATRKQVNFALRRFGERGWLDHGYRSIALRDAAAMRTFVAAEDAA